MLNGGMLDWWSWPAASAIASSSAVIVALFGEKIRRWIFRPKIQIIEYSSLIQKPRVDLADPTIYEHYLEVLNGGDPIDDASIEVLAFSFTPQDLTNTRIVWPLPIRIRLQSGPSISSRDVVKIAEVEKASDMPTLNFNQSESPWAIRNEDPHYRGRIHLQVVGRSYRSDVWSVDLVRDSRLTSGWRLEVMESVDEQSFLGKRRNYVREYNEKKRRENLP